MGNGDCEYHCVSRVLVKGKEPRISTPSRDFVTAFVYDPLTHQPDMI